MWQEVLPLVTSTFGGVGAACFSYSDHTKSVEWVYASGPLLDQRTEYIEHYAQVDLFIPALLAEIPGDWLTLSKVLPDSSLRHNDWYQDFLLASGVADVVGSEIYRAGPSRIYFGVQFATVQSIPPSGSADLQVLFGHLAEAARVGQMRRMLSLRNSIGTWAIDHLRDALFITDATGRVVEMNAAAELMLSGGHGLAVRYGRLVATESAKAAQLASLMATAGRPDASNAAASHMLLGGAERPYTRLVTVFTLGGGLPPDDRAMVVVRAVDLRADPSSSVDLAEIFGLSPAERRLAQGLAQGKTLQELTKEFGVRMPTLRAQIRSVFRKCGVKRQADLMRVLLRTY